jgi:hypothetical protein
VIDMALKVQHCTFSRRDRGAGLALQIAALGLRAFLTGAMLYLMPWSLREVPIRHVVETRLICSNRRIDVTQCVLASVSTS